MHQLAGGKNARCLACFDRIRTRGLFPGGPGPQGHSILESHLVHDHELQMSPAGKDSWGPDQCRNDRDETVDHDERLRITVVELGRYDVKLTVLCSDDCWSCRRNNEIDLQSSELGGELGEALNASLRPAMRRRSADRSAASSASGSRPLLFC